MHEIVTVWDREVHFAPQPKGEPEIQSPTGGRLVGSVADGEKKICTLQILVVEVLFWVYVDVFCDLGPIIEQHKVQNMRY